jgi:hypothetical protein
MRLHQAAATSATAHHVAECIAEGRPPRALVTIPTAGGKTRAYQTIVSPDSMKIDQKPSRRKGHSGKHEGRLPQARCCMVRLSLGDLRAVEKDQQPISALDNWACELFPLSAKASELSPRAEKSWGLHFLPKETPEMLHQLQGQ